MLYFGVNFVRCNAADIVGVDLPWLVFSVDRGLKAKL
jgi:hypothetical protein